MGLLWFIDCLLYSENAEEGANAIKPSIATILLLFVHCIFLLFHFFSHPSLLNLKGWREQYAVAERKAAYVW